MKLNLLWFAQLTILPTTLLIAGDLAEQPSFHHEIRPLWSIYEEDSPKSQPSQIHFLTRYGLSLGDTLWNCLPNSAQQLLWPNISIGSIPCPHEESLSGDFFALSEKGLLRFILDKLVQASSNDPWLTIRMATVPMFVMLDHNMVRQILNSKHVRRGLAYNRLVDFFGYGIFTSKIYDRWKEQKTIAIKLLHNKPLEHMAPTLYRTMLNELRRASEKAQKEPLDLVFLLSKIGLVAFCEAVLGVNIDDIADQLAGPINRLLAYINGALEPIAIPFGADYQNFIRDRDFVHAWMGVVIERVRENAITENAQNNPLVDHIIETTDPKRQNELIELMISMVLGGHETTARLMLGAIYSLMKHPDYYTQIQNEIDDYLKTHEEESIDHDAILKFKHFPLLELVIEESLRLYPPVWVVARTPEEDIIVGENQKIAKGTQILISPLLLQRSKAIFGADAEIFRPERFLDLSTEAKKNFFPFLLGPEKCPGDKFAKMEAMLAIAGLLHNFDITLADPNEPPKPTSLGTFRLFPRLSVILAPRSKEITAQ